MADGSLPVEFHETLSESSVRENRMRGLKGDRWRRWRTLRGPPVSGRCFAKPPKWTGRNLNRNHFLLNRQFISLSKLEVCRTQSELRDGNSIDSSAVREIKPWPDRVPRN
jgi:hypothetical protein